MSDLNEHDRLTQTYFDKWADTFEERGSIFRYFQNRVISLISFSDPSNFLDLGCGTGWAVRYVASLLKGNGHFVGIDISGKMIKRAKEIAIEMKNVNFYQANSEELPLGNNYFDNIICTLSFHHYLHPEKALSEVQRVLKPGGKIYILDITADDFFNKLIDKLIRRIQKEHVKQYSSLEYKQMFSQAGLKYERSKVILLYPVKVQIGEK